MADASLPLLSRLWLALVCLIRVVYDAQFAAGVASVRERLAMPLAERPALPEGLVVHEAQPPRPAAMPAEVPAPAVPKPTPAASKPSPAAPEADLSQALHLLTLLQREGRLLDFLEEELSGFSDANIGAAARTVHAGCRKVLRAHFGLVPVRTEVEGAQITLPQGFDASAVRLTGNVVGSPPFTGTLRHHGWRAARVSLPPPPAAQEPTLLAPAEVELP